MKDIYKILILLGLALFMGTLSADELSKGKRGKGRKAAEMFDFRPKSGTEHKAPKRLSVVNLVASCGRASCTFSEATDTVFAETDFSGEVLTAEPTLFDTIENALAGVYPVESGPLVLRYSDGTVENYDEEYAEEIYQVIKSALIER